MDEKQADRILDVRGWSCPWCILKAKSWLNRMSPGQVLKVISTDPNVMKNFPRILERTGDRVIHMEQVDDHFQLYVRRSHEEELKPNIASLKGATEYKP